MNVFRILGDLSHLLAMILLLGKICRSKSCAGEGVRAGPGGPGLLRVGLQLRWKSFQSSASKETVSLSLSKGARR